jgi:hypothetical protein
VDYSPTRAQLWAELGTAFCGKKRMAHHAPGQRNSHHHHYAITALTWAFIPIAQDFRLIKSQDVCCTVRPIARLISPHCPPGGQLVGTVGRPQPSYHRILRNSIDAVFKVVRVLTLAGYEPERQERQPSRCDQPFHRHGFPHLPRGHRSRPGAEALPWGLHPTVMRDRPRHTAPSASQFPMYRTSRRIPTRHRPTN